MIKTKKLAALATKSELKEEQDQIDKLQAFDSNNFLGQTNFEDDGTQKYLLFQPVSRYFKTVGNTNKVTQKIQKDSPMRILNFHQSPKLVLVQITNFINSVKMREKFDGSCLKQKKPYLHINKW